MYEAAPSRPRKTNITRSRNGCKQCRQKRAKCDERKPCCSLCSRVGRACEYPQPAYQFRSHNPSTRDQNLVTIQSQQTTNISKHKYPVALDNSVHGSFVLDFHLSAPRVRTERQLLYMTHWEKSCLPALGSVFAQLSKYEDRCSILFDAILALSACNMSRTYPEFNTSQTSHDQDLTHRPHTGHFVYNQTYYNSAIRRLIKLTEDDYRNNQSSILAALLLFCYMESSVCNFRGYSCHVKGISSLLESEKEIIESEACGIELLTIWEHSKFYNWWIRVHFSTLNFQRSQNAVHLEPQRPGRHRPGRHRPGSGRRATILSILCESYRISSQAYLLWWECQASNHYYDEKDEYYNHLLYEESRRLDKWVSELDASDSATGLPSIGLPTTFNLDKASQQLRPICFAKHEEALDYAYYAAARVMQCLPWEAEISSNMPSGDGIACTKNNYWMTKLLQVVQNIKHSDAVSQNVYTVGISSLLLACILRSTSVTAGIFVEDWLCEFEKAQIFEEGSLPIAQMRAIVSMINRQKRDGFDVFAISLMAEDDGGIGKFNSYNNQILDDVLIFGRESHTSRAFSKCVPLSNK